MSFEAITTIRDAENRAKADPSRRAGGRCSGSGSGSGRGQRRRSRPPSARRSSELQTLRAKSDEKAKADAEKLAAETKNKEAAMRIKAKTNLDRAASLIVERIVNG